MKLRFTVKAADELDAILDFIKERSPTGARRARQRIEAVADHLIAHPMSGALRAEGIRRLQVYPYPYLIFYELLDDEIVVIGVRHAARDPSSMPGA